MIDDEELNYNVLQVFPDISLATVIPKGLAGDGVIKHHLKGKAKSKSRAKDIERTSGTLRTEPRSS